MPTNDDLNRLVRALTIRQRWTIGLVSALLLAGIFGFLRWQRDASFRPLFTNLAAEDAGPVVQKLKEGGVLYKLSNGGATILVPEDRVAELRLEMAGDGLPKSGRLGFEIFDKNNFGITEFTEHVNYRRALEGELERSIMSVAQIEEARVHISLPEESVFLEAKEPAKASVLIKIRRGMNLPDSAVPAITNLVASAVEGLTPDNVALLDMHGDLLNRPKPAGAADESSNATLEYRQKVEHDLKTKLDSTLEPLLGLGRFRTAISADCDMKSGEQSEETFDPDHSVMVSSQKTEDESNQSHLAEGVPGTASNLPDNTPKQGGGSPTVSRKTENITYETSHTVKRLTLPQGEIQRLSVSVLLDYDIKWDGSKKILNPPSPERLQVIKDVVAAAAGLNTQRGDQLIVESLPFESTLNLDMPDSGERTVRSPAGKTTSPLAQIDFKQFNLAQLKKNPKLLIGIAAAFSLALAGIVFAVFKVLKMKRARQAAAEVRMQPLLPAPAEAPVHAMPLASAQATPTAAPEASAIPALGPSRLESLTAQVRSVTQANSEVCAGVLRGWLKQEEV
jgi:flagellar M-ring protein FliF